MLVSIVTPSFRSGAWLKLCIASVADQHVELEHIVQDAGSDDGTLDWLSADGRVRLFVEKDAGMYDAVNRGLRRARGDILAYLNCDEQYLPGALRQVVEFFAKHPQVAVAFGDAVMVDGQGNYLWHRKMQVPLLYHTWTCHLSTLTCGTFFRRSLFFERGFSFAPGWRDSGDGEWMVRLLCAGVPMAALGCFTSAFTVTGANMSGAANARQEEERLHASAPLWARRLRPALVLQHRLRRWLGGMYRCAPFSYSLYTASQPQVRRQIRVEHPCGRKH